MSAVLLSFFVFFLAALTAPGFGTATTTAAAPATGFSFGSTNTGTLHWFVTKNALYDVNNVGPEN